jgi:two-component system sensor kinase
LQKHAADLEASKTAIESFSYSISHDLRAPLRAIDGFSHVLAEKYEATLDDQGKRLLGVIRGSTKKMSQLIDDILAFSRVGRQEMGMTEFDMEALVRSVWAELEPMRVGRDVRLHVITPMPPAWGDPAMLRQTLVNLLANAVKFSSQRVGALIEVGACVAQGECIYHVRDNGAGFDQQYAHKLFGVFQRLHGMEEFEGTGIGLAIVKSIIVRHGGRVWAEGAVDQGATIYFSLPTKES